MGVGMFSFFFFLHHMTVAALPIEQLLVTRIKTLPPAASATGTTRTVRGSERSSRQGPYPHRPTTSYMPPRNGRHTTATAATTHGNEQQLTSRSS